MTPSFGTTGLYLHVNQLQQQNATYKLIRESSQSIIIWNNIAMYNNISVEEKYFK